jgi:hypothetical protein
MNTFDIGDLVTLSIGFAHADTGDPGDPDAVTLEVRPRGHATAVYIYGDGDTIVRDATGEYHADIDVDSPGVWSYRWSGTGALQGAEEASFYVRRQAT